MVPLKPGEKSPVGKGWSAKELTLTTEEDVQGLTHAGLAHAFSGTCCLDIDDVREAVRELRGLGIDLLALLKAPDAVRIDSGRKNRAKLLYALPEPLPSFKLIKTVDGVERNIIDFRCGTRGGASVQDAMPPTPHPTSGQPYRWRYNDSMVAHWSDLPPVPEKVLAYWQSRIAASTADAAPPDREYGADELRKLLEPIDPDTDYLSWVNVGMALHHASEGSREGLAVWDEWSSQGAKYKGKRDLVPHWESFQGGGITVDYLYMNQVAHDADFDEVEAPAGEEGKADEEERFKPVHIGDWVQRPPPTWLIDGLLPESDLAMAYGASGAGKSFFVLDLALHVSLGLPWREKSVVQGNVVWIAAEAAGSVRNRALAFASAHNVDMKECPLWVIGETPSLGDLDHVRKIAKGTKKLQPKLLVVDTLAAASGGANENSGEDMGAILAACRALHRITGALVLLVHHSGKDGSKGARGWSGLRAAMQTEIEVAIDPTGERRAKVVKQRDAEQDQEYGFKLVGVNLAPFDDKPQESCYVEPVDGVLILDEIPHSGHISTAINILTNAPDLTLRHGDFDKALGSASRSAGEDKVSVGGELAQVAKVLLDAGVLIDDGTHYTLISMPAGNASFAFGEGDEFDSLD